MRFQTAPYQLQSLLPDLNTTISTDMDIKNAAGAYWDTDPTRLGLDANINSMNEIQVNGIRDPGFNFAALGRSAGVLQAGPWLSLSAKIVIVSESAYLGEAIGPVASALGQIPNVAQSLQNLVKRQTLAQILKGGSSFLDTPTGDIVGPPELSEQLAQFTEQAGKISDAKDAAEFFDGGSGPF
jgi:hypothetical protein